MLKKLDTLKRILHDYLEPESCNSKYIQLKGCFTNIEDFYDISIEVISELNYLYEESGREKYLSENFIYSSIKNASITFWRSNTDEEKRPLTNFYDNIDFDAIVDKQYDFKISNIEFVQIIHRIAMRASLTEQEFAILLDSRYHNMTQSEIAKKYSISTRTVGSRMASIKKKLSKINIYEHY